MKQIFLMSQCQYTHLGLSELMESAGKQRVIVVDLTCHESSVTVKALWFLWNLSVLYSERHELRDSPCIFPGYHVALNTNRYLFVGFLLHNVCAS